MNHTLRERFTAALRGEPIAQPIYAVYDWFVEHRPLDWSKLFDLGLGQINHATVISQQRPHVQVVETTSQDASGQTRRDVRWITDIGELHEWYLGEWQQEYFIKTAHDYRIMARALSDIRVQPTLDAFAQSEAQLQGQGITLGVPASRRTAFQAIQIDLAGLERFALDLAMDLPELWELVEVMNDLTYREFTAVGQIPVRYIKLWENLSIETLGPVKYRQHLVPVYRRLLELLEKSGQKLLVHYDGKLRGIEAEIAALGFDGIDSFTEPPEGDLSVAEARHAWPDKFLWLHPNLGWYRLPERALRDHIARIMGEAGPRRYCLMISEDVPPDWERTVPLILRMLQEASEATRQRHR